MNVKAQAEMLRLETRAKFPYLVDIMYNDGTVAYRLCNADEDITFDGNVYTGSVFSLVAPDIKENSIGNGSVSFSAIDQTAIELVRGQSKRLRIRFVGVIQYNDDDSIETVEALEDTEYFLKNVSWDDEKISGTLVFDEFMDVNIPCHVSNSCNTPGLV